MAKKKLRKTDEEKRQKKLDKYYKKNKRRKIDTSNWNLDAICRFEKKTILRKRIFRPESQYISR